MAIKLWTPVTFSAVCFKGSHTQKELTTVSEQDVYDISRNISSTFQFILIYKDTVYTTYTV
jgi:hypothetical protein